MPHSPVGCLVLSGDESGLPDGVTPIESPALRKALSAWPPGRLGDPRQDPDVAAALLAWRAGRSGAAADVDELVIIADREALPAAWWPRFRAAAKRRPDAGQVVALGDGALALLSDAPHRDVDSACHAVADLAPLAVPVQMAGLMLWRWARSARPESCVAVCVLATAGARHGAKPHPAITALELRLAAALRSELPLYGRDDRAVVVHVIHGWGGGAQRFVTHLAAADTSAHHLVLAAVADPSHRAAAVGHSVAAAGKPEPWLEVHRPAPIAAMAIADPTVAALVASLQERFGIDRLVVSSLLGSSLDLLATGLPTTYVCHDYLPLWPRLHEDFGRGNFAPAELDALIGAAPEKLVAPGIDAAQWRTLREQFVRRLIAGRIAMVAPSQGAMANWQRIEPRLAELDWRVIPHASPAISPAKEPVGAKRAARLDAGPLRVLVPGRLNGGKGEDLLAALLPSLGADVEFVLLGAGRTGMRWFGQSDVHVVLDYQPDELAEQVAALQPDCALLPSTVAETFSFTLSEMWQLGVPVIATALGALAERIRDGETGLLVAADAASVAGLLSELAADRSRLDGLRPGPVDEDLQGMARKWLGAGGPAEVVAQPTRVERVALPAPIADGDRALLIALERDQAERQSQSLDQALKSLDGTVASLQRQLDERGRWGHQLASQLDDRSRWARSLAGELQNAQSAWRSAAHELDARTRWIESLEAEVGRARERVASLSAELDSRTAWAKSLNAEVKAKIQWARSLEAELADRTRWAKSLDAELQAKIQWGRSLEAELEDRTRWAKSLDAELRARIQWGRSLEAELKDRTHWAQSLDAELLLLRNELGQRQAVAERMQNELDQANHAVAQLERFRDALIDQRDAFEDERNEILASRSWRMTRPLRGFARAVRQSRERLAFAARRYRAMISRGRRSLAVRGLSGTLGRLRREFDHGDFRFEPPNIPSGTPDPLSIKLPVSALPCVSIVIPVHNHVDTTLVGLAALAALEDQTAWEVVVVDDASTDPTPRVLPDVDGLRLVRLDENQGFIGACNAGAAAAKGDVLIFLNNDTAAQSGFVDALRARLDDDETIGLVGAKLVYPDGRLQEAGGIVFKDASGWNYGRFEDPRDPRFNFFREADYCSGAAIAVRRRDFEALGGFDPHYAPAYYEDTDLAMRFRAEGKRVVYEPRAEVVHFEGVTSGTDLSAGAKAFQVVNRVKFLERWADALQSHPAPGTDIAIASQHRAVRRVLVVDATTPEPDQDSGSVRLVNLFRLLLQRNCAVTFLPANHAFVPRYTQDLQSLGVEVWHEPYLPDLLDWIRAHGSRFDDIVVCRHYVLSGWLPLLRKHAPQARVIFDTVDLHFLRERREAELVGRDDLRAAAERTRAIELGLVAASDLTLVVSEVEARLLESEVPGAAIAVLSNVHQIPGSKHGFDARKDIVFVGGYQHPPNVDGARWFVESIWPQIHAALPEVRFHLVGSKAPDSVAQLGRVPGVEFHGYVADIAPLMDGCRIAVAPLRYGAGVKGKVNLSMAHGQPVVATSCAVEGIGAIDGVDALIADDAVAFANAVIRLYGDAGLWRQLSAAGIVNVERKFSFAAAGEALDAAFERAKRAKDASRPGGP